MSSSNNPQTSGSRKVETVAIVFFVVVNLVAPFVVGELYPFTVSPMFRDQPDKYCTYQLFDGSGNELALETFGLHLVYDGNPPGLGMGIQAKPTLHKFGEVPEISDVAAHVRATLIQQKNITQVRILQSVVCCNGTCPETEVRETTVSLNQKMGD